MYDIVIRGGTLVDGTGVPGQTADITVDRGRIVEIGRTSTSSTSIDSLCGDRA